MDGRFVGFGLRGYEWIPSCRLSRCACFVTPDNADDNTSGGVAEPQCLSPLLGYALCTINCSLGRKTPAAESSFCHSLCTALSTSGVLWVSPRLAFGSWRPGTVDKWDYAHLFDNDVTFVTQQKPHSVSISENRLQARVQSLERIMFMGLGVNGGS